MSGQRRGIAVGYDGSAGGRVALDWAAEAARRHGEPLLVVHALEANPGAASPGFSPTPGSARFAQDERAVLDAALARVRPFLGQEQVSAQVVQTSAAAGLVDASEQAVMVVTGCRGRSRLAAGLLGSVSYAVTAHAHCPAVVVRGEQPAQPGPAHKVVVGIDDSGPSQRALDLAAGIAAGAGASLHVVSVGTLASPESWAYVETSSAGSKRTHAAVEELEQTTERAASRARDAHPDLPVEAEVLFGHPGLVLAELAQQAGLLVVGSRGRGGFAGLLLGSVSHRVVHEASCAVMVVHEDD